MKTLSLSTIFTVSVITIAAQDAHHPQVTPSALIKRQANLDSYYSALGNPNEYIITNLGTSTNLVSYDGSSYHYIEGHTKYFSETVTTTINNSPTTTTTTGNVVASTAKDSAGDVAAGDLTLTFSEDVAKALTDSARKVAEACGIAPKAKKMRREDPASCLINHAQSITESGSPLDAAATEEWWESLVINLVDHPDVALTAALQVLKTKAQRNKMLILYIATYAAAVIKASSVATVKIPAEGVGSKTETKKCDPKKSTKDENSPICQDDDCKGNENDEICTVGDDKGCPCVMEYSAVQDDIDKDWADQQQSLLAKIEAGDIPHTEYHPPTPECDVRDSSQIPNNVFQPTVYKRFCDELSKRDAKSPFGQIVDIKGNAIPPKAKRGLGKRTPPPDPGNYAKYTIELTWSGGDSKCPSDCAQAFYNTSQSQCGHTAGEQNIMAKHTKLDTGCGIYNYTINIPSGEKTPSLGPVQCFDPPGNDIKCWKDVKKEQVDETAETFGEHQLGFLDMNNNGGMMRPQTGNVTQVFRPDKKGVTYMMVIGWRPGCKDQEQLNARNPIPYSEATNWSDLLKNNYYECKNNKGRGGFTDVGCLRYGFYPNNAGTFSSPPHPEKFFDKMSYCG